jgi:hypothetical protein
VLVGLVGGWLGAGALPSVVGYAVRIGLRWFGQSADYHYLIMLYFNH